MKHGHGWLGAEIVAAVGQAPTGEFEGRINTQEVKVVSVLVAAGDRQNPGADHVCQRMGDPQRIAMVGEATCHSVGEAKTPIGRRQQHHAAVGADASAINDVCEFSADFNRKSSRGGLSLVTAIERLRTGMASTIISDVQSER